MMRDELAINLPPPSIAIFDGMPELDFRFAQLPAQVHFPIMIKGWEVYQPHFDVLELAADLLNPFCRTLQASRRSIFQRSKLNNSLAGWNHASGERNAMRDPSQFRVCLLIGFLLFAYATQKAFYFREQSFGFKQVEISGHGGESSIATWTGPAPLS